MRGGLSGDIVSFRIVLHLEQKNWMLWPEVAMRRALQYRL
jgi:hypothetical protein